MFARLLALFLIMPVVELALLIQLGGIIGFWPTIGIIVLTGVAGSYLAKREGLSVWRRFNERLQHGQLPGNELVDGVIILVSGALLITPGVLSDLAGFIGLLPFTRRHLRHYINRRVQKAVERGRVRMTFGGFEMYDPAAFASDDRARSSPDGSGTRAAGRNDAAGRAPYDDVPDADRWSGEPEERPRYGGD